MMNKETIQRRALFSGFILLNTVKCLLIYCILVFWEVSRTNLLFHFGVLFFSIFMVYCVLYFSKNKGLLLTFYVIQAIYLLVNLLYFLYFKSYLTAGIVFTLFVNVHDLLSSQSIPFNSSILLLFIDVPVLIACLIQKEKTPALKTYQRLLVIVAVILVGSALLFEAYQFRLTRTASKYGGNTKYVFEYGLLGYQIKDYKENGLKHSVKKDVLFHYGKLIQSSNEEKIKKNIVFIQVESMGGDAEFLKNRDQWVMPLHAFIDIPVRFLPVCHELSYGRRDFRR